MSELGKVLRELRGNRSLRNISKIAGISHNYLRNLEIGIDPRTKSPINPSPETLKKLAEAYNYPYEELLKLAGYLDANEKDGDSKIIPTWATKKTSVTSVNCSKRNLSCLMECHWMMRTKKKFCVSLKPFFGMLKNETSGSLSTNRNTIGNKSGG